MAIIYLINHSTNKLFNEVCNFIFGFYHALFVIMPIILCSPDDSGANASGAKRFGR
jgi:hypothetical protein